MRETQLGLDRGFPKDRFSQSPDFVARPWHEAMLAAHKKHRAEWWTSHPDSKQHTFTVVAGTGTGKTAGAGYVASDLFGSRERPINHVVVVVPTRIICEATIETYKKWFNIYLYEFHGARHRNSAPRGTQGYVICYGSLLNQAGLHREIIGSFETLVVPDEVHHLGDRNSWGECAVEAFGLARYILPLSGTPYRHGKDRISLVTYLPSTEGSNILKFKADYRYTLGSAIIDGYCRDPIFHLFDGSVMIRKGDKEKSVSFSDKIDDIVEASARLRGAIVYGSPIRKGMLRIALEMIRTAHRKVIIFLGGDTNGDQAPTMDATDCLPLDLQELGIGPEDYEVVIGDGKAARSRIKAFGKSRKWILISVNLVSEGADIPELSAAIFLTSITTKMTTMQRIGRTLRRMGPNDPFDRAWIFFIADERFVALESELRGEIRHEIDLARREREPNGERDPGEERPSRTEATGISGGEMISVSSHGRILTITQIQEKQRWLREQRRPSTAEDAIRFLEWEQMMSG
jgi:superfamily II DNA or RNA helicase